MSKEKQASLPKEYRNLQAYTISLGTNKVKFIRIDGKLHYKSDYIRFNK